MWNSIKECLGITSKKSGVKTIEIPEEFAELKFKQLIPVSEVKKLNLKDGDVVVLETEGTYSPVLLSRIKGEFEGIIFRIGVNAKCCILSSGLKLSAVLSKETTEERNDT